MLYKAHLGAHTQIPHIYPYTRSYTIDFPKMGMNCEEPGGRAIRRTGIKMQVCKRAKRASEEFGVVSGRAELRVSYTDKKAPPWLGKGSTRKCQIAEVVQSSNRDSRLLELRRHIDYVKEQL